MAKIGVIEGLLHCKVIAQDEEYNLKQQLKQAYFCISVLLRQNRRTAKILSFPYVQVVH
jgi:hypothetical protein